MYNSMTKHAYFDLVLLAAIWGGSFLFMRIGSPELGALLFTALRTSTAAIFLYLCIVKRKKKHELKGQWSKLFISGVINTAIPFSLFSYATLTLSASSASVLNATTPMFGAIVGFFWLKDKLSMSAILGLIIGFIGVYLLVSDNINLLKSQINIDNEHIDLFLAPIAALIASLCYGIAANYTKRYLHDIKPLALATGSQICASLTLLPLCLFFLPNNLPSPQAISSVIISGVICTGVAYILFFRLVNNIGPTKTICVTYLIPAFGLLWGMLFLDEQFTLTMIAGTCVILFGVALTSGRLRPTNKSQQPKKA